ncbi:hypothetical protein [Methanobacterium sp.]|jgi:hypothetical protein|nr:hypothetical protein [Methanobacterium sp.]
MEDSITNQLGFLWEGINRLVTNPKSRINDSMVKVCLMEELMVKSMIRGA